MCAHQRTTFSILQYNVQKSYDVMNLLLKNKESWEFDIIAIQEPWINSYGGAQTHNPSAGRFRTFLSNTPDRPLVCFFINTRLNATDVRVTGRSQHLCSAHINIQENGVSRSVTIHNIYNTHVQDDVYTEGRWEGLGSASVLPELDLALEKYKMREQVVVGDFNLHHTHWYGTRPLPARRKRQAQSRLLIDLMGGVGLELATPPGTITRPRNDTRSVLEGTVLDLSWCSETLLDRVSSCRVREDLDMASDHMPVETILMYRTQPPPPVVIRNFKKMDTVEFRSTLHSLLPSNAEIDSPNALEERTTAVTLALQTAAINATPTSTITMRSVPGHTEECKAAIREVKETGRAWRRTGDAFDLIRYQEAKRIRKHTIKAAQTQAHRDKVSTVTDEKGLWSLAKWARTRDSNAAAFTPDIAKPDGTMAEDTAGKAEALRGVFFPQPPEADLTDTMLYNYPLPCEEWTEIVDWEVTEALRIAPPDKAPGEDGIPNRVLKAAVIVLTPTLTNIFNASVRLKYCPTQFKKSITVALRKPGKDDYSQPKSYRPIALMNTFGKILDTILARRIQEYAERHSLLPQTHTGGRKQSSCEHGIHLLMEKIHTSWRKNKVASLLLLDVSGAFDNVSHERLLHNMRKRKLPMEIINWIASYLTDRVTCIKLFEGISETFDIATGIPQGSPLSPILYLFYNADLIELGRSSELVTGYIDDTSFLVEGSTTESTTRRLEVLHCKADEWARQHASVFAYQKYELVHFVHKNDRRKIGNRDCPVDLGPKDGKERVIAPTTHARYLGVILDSELNSMEHLEHIRSRVLKSIQALRSISGSTWGVTREQMITLFKSIIIPQLTFACSTWWIIHPIRGRKTHQKKIITVLNQLQKDALCAATGALRTTAASVIEAETDTLPIRLRLDQISMISANRIKASPMYHLMSILRERGHPQNATRLSPLQEVELECMGIIGREAHKRIERKATVVAPPWWTPMNIHIAQDTKVAIQEHDELQKENLTAHMQVFTDGSDIRGRVGAAAWEPHRKWKGMIDIGPTDQFTVYGAELIGIWMALDMGRRGGGQIRKLTIFTDNQAAIVSSQRPRNQSGQVILKHIYNLTRILQKRGVKITIRWIPAHEGVPGNEEVDELAKRATGWQPKGERGASKKGEHMKWLPQLLSSCKRMIKQEIRRRWNTSWNTYTTTGGLYRYRRGGLLDRHINEIYTQDTKAESSVLIQMRTEKISLQGYLHKIKRADTPWCECNNSYQTVNHIICECEDFEDLREHIFGARYLHSAKDFLREIELIPKTIRFMLSTGLLDQFRRLTAFSQLE